MKLEETLSLAEKIDQTIGQVRTESLDLSFGEIINLHETGELVIQPEYQRLFRWSDHQKSRLIESILIELPIPQIFVVENNDGTIELIDGLQRVSSIIQFISPEKLPPLEPLVLRGCDLIPELNGLTFAGLPTRLRLRLKRSSVRTVIIKRQTKFMIRYDMFRRLNTGGSILSPQEIRNASARMIGEHGTRFNAFIQDLARESKAFLKCTELLADSEKEKRGDEELVLRFFATTGGRDLFRGNVQDWLDEYMEEIITEKRDFDYDTGRMHFEHVFNVLSEALGEGAFVRYRGNAPIGGLAPAYFEAITGGVFEIVNRAIPTEAGTLRTAVIETVQSEQFRKFTGPGANTRTKLEGRIQTIVRAIEDRRNV